MTINNTLHASRDIMYYLLWYILCYYDILLWYFYMMFLEIKSCHGRHVTRGRGVSKTSVIPLTPTLGTVSLITILMFVAFVLSTIRGECSISHFISCSLKFTLSSYSSLLEFLCTTNCFPAWRYLFQFWTWSNKWDNPLAKIWTLVQPKESPVGSKM